jgi:hypothetical protein
MAVLTAALSAKGGPVSITEALKPGPGSKAGSGGSGAGASGASAGAGAGGGGGGGRGEGAAVVDRSRLGELLPVGLCTSEIQLGP